MAIENAKTCPHDCTRCTTMQQILCGAQFSRMNAESLERIEDLLKKLVNDRGGVFNPVAEKQAVS